MDPQVRRLVSDLLRRRDFGSLSALCERDRQYWQEVRFRLYDVDEVLRWSAIEAAARFMLRRWVSGSEEKVRIYIRTLFWSLTDESGGIGWSAPQTIAEIIVQIPELIDSYGSMMIAHSIDEPPLVKGCLWGIGRLGPLIRGSMEFFSERIVALFRSGDEEILGLLAWALGESAYSPALPYLRELKTCAERARIYIDGDFRAETVGWWAMESVAKIEQANPG